MENSENILKLYSVELNEFMGVIEIKSESGESSSHETIVLLDQSGSMEEVLDKIPAALADAFNSLGYQNQETINLITFNSNTQHFAVTLSDLKSVRLVAEGKSLMSPAVRKCIEIFKSFNSNEMLRVLVISDGEISDEIEAKSAIQELAECVRSKKLKINLQILKLLCDEKNKDSEILNDLTKINNVENPQILSTSINEQSAAMSMKISSLFNDKSSCNWELTSVKKNILKFPWDGLLTDHIDLQTGKNIFSIQGIPSPNDFKLNGQKLKSVIEPPMNLHNYHQLIEESFSFITKELCKVTVEEFTRITKQVQEYFERRETIFIEKYEKTEKNKFTRILEKIVEDESIKNMSMEEKAEYLRKTEFHKRYQAKKAAAEKANIKLHPVDDNELIATVNIDAKNRGVDAIQTIIILDRSLSMGDSARRMTNDVIPEVLKKLSYDDKKMIYFVTFDSIGDSHTATVNQMRTLPITCRGCTNMATGVLLAHDIFKTLDPSKPVRLLTISDGIIDDRNETEQAANTLYNYLEDKNFSINSQAVRFFTSANQPDTTALCSLLRLNNVTTCQLLDLCVRDDFEEITDKIADLFDDGFTGSQVLRSKKKNILKNPWDKEPTDSLRLMPGQNVFWVLGIPEEDFELEDEIIEKVMAPQLSIQEFQIIMEEKFQHIIDHMKILKIIETTETNETIMRILKYFMSREEELYIRSPPMRKVVKLFDENFTKKSAYQTTSSGTGGSKIKKVLKLFPLKDTEFIGTIENEGEGNPEDIETIVIVDRSGSMEESVEKVLNEMIPLTLEKLSYKNDQIIHVIAFNEKSLLYPLTMDQMRVFPLVARGKSFMTNAIEHLSQLFMTFKDGSSIRLLTISDGKVTDRDEVEKTAQKLADLVTSRNFTINSQAVRIFTSDYLPDKSSLCSLVQVNNSTQPWVLDISPSESIDEVSAKIAKLYDNDNLGVQKTLVSDNKNILQYPWDQAHDELPLRAGKNILWFQGTPKNLKIDDTNVQIEVQPPLDLTIFHNLMEEELEFLGKQMKYFKELKSKEGDEKARKMLKYFQATEDYLISKSANRKITNLLVSQMSQNEN